METHTSSDDRLSGADGELAELLAELASRLQTGEQVNLEDYIQSHKEYAQQLEQMLPAMLTLAEMGLDQSSVFSSSTLTRDVSSNVSGNVGDYKLTRELGRGGMGVVYEAEQQSLGRGVALKILPFAALLNETQLERFATEATAAARLQHDNIVTVYSVGCERGIHFIAMQLIEGPSLAEVIAELRQERHPCDNEQQESAETVVARKADVLTRDEDGGHYRAVARIGREAAEALQYAHENGVLHRDIKPSNLLLDNSGHVWIADFGLARIEDESQLTRTGDILGTLHYMSPEQATGQRDQIDARSDVYGLGATLYELATLRPVFDNEDRGEVIKQVVAGNPVAPHKIAPSVPRPLSLVISKAMARRLDERYKSAQELADELQRFLDGEPVHARAPSPLRRVRTTLIRHPLITLSSTALLIVACLYIPNVLHRLGTNEPDNSSVTSSTDTGDPTMFRSAPKKRNRITKNQRTRPLRHEQLEDRRLLTTGSISGTVFEDLNANGVQDAGELGIADSTVVLQTDVLTIANPSTDKMAWELGSQKEDVFAWAVESMGNNIIVAAHKEDPAGVVNAGTVYLFDGLTGQHLQTFTDPEPREQALFGVSVSAVGDNVLVGTRRDVQGGGSQFPRDPGVAYLFDPNLGGDPIHIQTFHDPDPETEPVGDPTTDNWFGGVENNVAGFGSDFVLVGAPGGEDDLGAVYMFKTSDGSLYRTITGPPEAQHFGRSIAVLGNKILVGSGQPVSSNAVYLFDGTSDGPPLRTFVNPEPQVANFGQGLAMTDEFVFVSSSRQDVDDLVDVGAVFMFDISTGAHLHTFHNPNPVRPFGFGLRANGDHLLATAYTDDSLGYHTGTGYLFSISTGDLLTTFFDPTPAGDWFGARTAILENGNFALGCGGDDAAGQNTGSVFVFESPHTSTVISTDQTGNYTFAGLDADTYRISQAVPDGYVQNAPGGDGTYTVELADDETVAGNDFGNLPYTTFPKNADLPLKDARNASRPGVTTSTINVSGLGNILDVNVTVDISHSYVGQLSARLIAPDGTPVELFSNLGGDGDNFTDTEFDDNALVPITNRTAPFTGTFQPAGSFAVLDNIIASGEWQLEISDNAKGVTGTLNSWALDIAALPAPNTPPVAENDSANTDPNTAVTVQVLENDTDVDNDDLSVIGVTQPDNGTVVYNGTSVTYAPNAGFVGNDTFTYTVSDGRGGTDTGLVTVAVSEPGTDAAIYVYDIRFESKRGNKDWRAVFEIRTDSNNSGTGDQLDDVVPGAAIEVTFAGRTYTGTTDENGVFRTSWIRNIGSGSHVAEVQTLALLGYLWDLDMGYDGDEDGDGLPDRILNR